MEKKLLIVLIALLLNLTCFGGVLFVSAYLVSDDKIINSVTVGNAALDINEEFDDPGHLQPGMIITKKVHIRNKGLSPCMVRVMTAFSDGNAQKYAKITYDTENWECREDGYWYFNKPLKPGEETSNLFEHVEIAENVSEADLKGFEIIVYSECVDSKSGRF